MKPENFDIHELISSLQGTCSTIDDHLPDDMELEDLTEQDYADIDNEIFLCETCGWWCEIGEVSEHEDGVCTDCVEE